jgi:hypothetical protein
MDTPQQLAVKLGVRWAKRTGGPEWEQKWLRATRYVRPFAARHGRRVPRKMREKPQDYVATKGSTLRAGLHPEDEALTGS